MTGQPLSEYSPLAALLPESFRRRPRGRGELRYNLERAFRAPQSMFAAVVALSEAMRLSGIDRERIHSRALVWSVANPETLTSSFV